MELNMLDIQKRKETNKRSSTAYQQRKIANGLCPRCGQNETGKFVQCKPCRIKRASKYKELKNAQ